jgi:hypothetical protein
MTETKEQRRQRREKERLAYEAQQAPLAKCNAVSRKDNERDWASNEAVVRAATQAVTRALSGGFASRAARAAGD